MLSPNGTSDSSANGASPQRKDPPPEPDPFRGSVLLVDDIEPLLRSLSRHLRDAGFDVFPCTSAQSALEFLAEHSVDVVVSDIAMPGMDGIELLRQVREHERDLPVVLMTGSPTVDTATRAIDFGAVKYLIKPFEISDLLSAVTRSAQLHQLAVAKREALTLLGDPQPLHGDEELQASLRRVLDSLWIAFQPIVRAEDFSLFGYEALMRSDERGLPHPGAVLAAAERLGQLRQLGRLVRDRAANPVAIHHSQWQLFVNLHPDDLLDDTLLDPHTPLAAIASRVVLEITERASLDSIEGVSTRVAALRKLGFRIAIDDLGAGYAGLSSFVQLEPDFVKLDMSLIRDVQHSELKRKLIRSMTSLCKEMGALVVAEGIETLEESKVVIELGCDLLQGFHYGRPRRGLSPRIPDE